MANLLGTVPEASENEAEVSNPLTSSVSGSSAIFIERMVILQDAAESLLCKLYELYTMQDYLATDFPKLSEILIKKFPEHPKEINLSKVDKNNLERVLDNVEGMLDSLQPWYYCLVDVMEYYSGVLSVLGEANALLRSADHSYCESLVKSFAQTATDAVRVQILLASTPRILIVQLYALAYFLDYRSKPISGFDSHEKPHEHDTLLVFLMRFDSVIPCLQQDFADYQLVVEKGIKNIFGPYCALSSSTDMLAGQEIFTSETKDSYSIGPLAGLSHQQICENLVRVEEYRDWTLWLSIACPMILTDDRVLDFLRIILNDTMLLPIFRDINLWIHAEILVHSYPKMKQILKQRKQPRQGHKTNLRSMVVGSFSQACADTAPKHVIRREFVLQLLTKCEMSLSYKSNSGFREANQCMAALALARSEVIWHMHHWRENVPQGLPTVLKLPHEEPLLKKCPPTHILKIIEAMKGLKDKLLSQEVEVVPEIVAQAKEKAAKLYNMLEKFDSGDFSVTAKSIRSVLEVGFPKEGEEGNLTAMRISWLRYLTLYPIVKLQAIDSLSTEKYGLPLLAEIQDLVNGTFLMDKLPRQVAKVNNMKVVYYFIDKFNDILEESILSNLDIDELLQSVLEVHGSFMNNNHARCHVIVDDDVAKPVQGLLDSISLQVKNILLQIEEEGYGTYEGGTDIIRVASVKGKAKSGKRKSIKQSSIFEILDKKIASPSLLGKYKMLLGLVRVLSDCKNFELSRYCIKPKGYLYAALKSALESFLARTVGTSEPYPDPSALFLKVSKFVNFLQSFQSATTVNIQRLVRDVIYQEIPSRTKFRMPILAPDSDRTSTTISEKYAAWVVSSVVHQKDSVYSSKLRTFSKGSFSAGKEAVHFSANEMKAFLKVFGLYGTLAFWNEIERSIADSLSTIHKELTSNQTFIAEVIFATSQRGELRSLTELEAKSFLLEATINAARTLGRCINFLDMLSHASHLAFGKNLSGLQDSLVHALETNAVEVLDRNLEFQQAHLLSYALGRRVEGCNPVVASIFQNMSISSKSFDLVEQLFASFLSHTCWKSIQYHPESGTLDQDMFSISLAFRHLSYVIGHCTPGVANDPDRQSVSERFEAFSDTAAPLVFGDEDAAGPKLLFLEHMLDDLYFTQSILERHFPSILIKSAKQKFLQA
ncbi:hypothetical protein A3770_02p16830 [Chloropicon primus]|uniref:Uncharacterized protein n=1 Tax=Chloropicon primus TaxID=1764295 RepID=A0A5B8MHN5_9CHLO|nr:hypothetical protein A3770_02p16830 [Chloropicon primus]|eukprot:QDZ19165.1 hypothetical protein A3770_02p16830 [Chloropicon primus]